MCVYGGFAYIVIKYFDFDKSRAIRFKHDFFRYSFRSFSIMSRSRSGSFERNKSSEGSLGIF